MTIQKHKIQYQIHTHLPIQVKIFHKFLNCMQKYKILKSHTLEHMHAGANQYIYDYINIH